MSTTARAVAAAASPHDALVVIAIAIDDLKASIYSIEEQLAQPRNEADDLWAWKSTPLGDEVKKLATVERDEDTTTVTLKAPDRSKFEARWKFAEGIKLDRLIPDLDREAIEAYAKGGPLWLYLGNREVVMGLPVEVRRQMVQDVMEDDPDEAYKMARDVLKGEPGAKLAMGDDRGDL